MTPMECHFGLRRYSQTVEVSRLLSRSFKMSSPYCLSTLWRNSMLHSQVLSVFLVSYVVLCYSKLDSWAWIDSKKGIQKKLYFVANNDQEPRNVPVTWSLSYDQTQPWRYEDDDNDFADRPVMRQCFQAMVRGLVSKDIKWLDQFPHNVQDM